MSPTANIAQIAEEHALLEQTIARYDDAPAELRETIDLLRSLENDLKTREPRLEKLVEKRKEEHKDLDKLQRSTTKRLLTRMKHGGKEGLERRLEKEEREYIEAAQNEHNESVAIADIKAAIETAKLKKADLESQVAIRKEMVQTLDGLYQSAFDGPSPDFPEEDAAEDELREAEAHFEHIQARVSHEKNVFKVLEQAASCANQTQSALQSANAAATYDSFSIGGVWAQMAEADQLVRSQTLSAQAQRLLERARGLQPLVKPVPPPKIVSPEWLNVVFDNLYTDFMFAQKIKQSVDSVRQYQEGIFTECAASESRMKDLEHDASDAREFLKSRRRQLVAIRREILTRIREDGGVRVFTRPGGGPSSDGDGSGSGTVPPLPTYTAQPEEGSKVLARGDPPGIGARMISMPVPLHDERPSPPGYDSQPILSPPSFPKPDHDTNSVIPTSALPSGHVDTASSSARTYGPPPGPPPQLGNLATATSSPAPAASRTSHDTSQNMPRRERDAVSNGTATANGAQSDLQGPVSLASNNPYRAAFERVG